MNTQKLKANWLKTMTAAFAAAVMATGAHGAEKITVDEVANHYPWDGKVDCVTTLSGLETSGYDYKGAFTLSVKKDGANVRKTVTNDFASADGTYTNTFDCAALFGAGLYPNGGIAVDLVKEKQLGGVQLWKDGPYWAECNVGATKPEEFGYYFMWGDTNAYVYSKQNEWSGEWVSVKDETTLSGGFSEENCATYNKTQEVLIETGYIDSTTSNLVAKYDAATAHLGGPWRMPTSDEIQAVVTNCVTTWFTTNGVSGCLVTGKNEYATKSIFLPAAGDGNTTGLGATNLYGYYWSSTPSLVDASEARILNFFSGFFYRDSNGRYYGQTVRPVRTVTK